MAAVSSPIVCERGPHLLGAAPADPGTHDYWEYCCSCANFWRVDAREAAMAQCPVCERDVSGRFLCSHCNTICTDSSTPAKTRDFQLSLSGVPVPGCPACLSRPLEALLDHECETLQTSFSTNRTSCPFCDEKIAIPFSISFPASVSSFLSQHTGDRIEVSFAGESRQLVKANPGDFVLLSGQALPSHIVLPNRTEFASRDEFVGYFDDYYDCDGPFSGEIIVVHPAIVKKEGRGWSLQEVGRLRVEPRETATVLDEAEESEDSFIDEEPVVQVCPQCGASASSHYRFCKKCGTPLIGPVSTSDRETMSSPIEPTGAKPPWVLIGIVTLILLGGLVMLSVALGRNSTEQQLKDAIARGNLLAPSDESAYDLYAKLQRDGASPATLAAYRDELIPRLLQRPDELLNQVTLPRGIDGSVAEWDESQKLLAWATELKPQDKKLAAKLAYCEGRLAYLKSRPDDAIAAYQRAAKLDPEWATPLNSLGALLNERRRFAESRQYLAEAVRRKPDWALPYNNLGTSFFYENRTAEAQVNYEKARDLAPNWARPHAWLGSIALKQKDYCTASYELDQALKLATPNMTNWHTQRIQNDLDAARTACAATSEE